MVELEVDVFLWVVLFRLYELSEKSSEFRLYTYTRGSDQYVNSLL